jgi:uncharacterized membrane protein YdjX (TVP38/TMEM64 family)
MKKTLIAALVIAVVAALAAASWHAGWDIVWLEKWTAQNAVLGGLVYIGAFVLSTILPVTALPLLPLAARTYGVWSTVLLTTAGWWIGCLLAFLIARWGRDCLERFTSLNAVERLERRIPCDISFMGIVILRLVFPGDLVGFALGLLRHLRFSTFAVASLLGTVPTAIVLSYAGGELGSGRLLSFSLLMVGATLALFALRRLWQMQRSRVRA